MLNQFYYLELMITVIRKKRIYKVFVWSAFLICLIFIYSLISNNGSTIIPFGDTVSYWATGRLLLSGENPYSAEEVLKIQDEVGDLQTSPLNEISMNLYPPWATTFALPLGFFSYPLTRIIWFLFHTIIILISAKVTWQIYDGPSVMLIIPFLITISFFPTMLLLGVGHNSGLLLLGACGFLFFIQKPDSSPSHYLLAGACAVLMTIRPQILYLILIALLFWAVYNKAWMVLLGGFLAVSTLTLVSMVFDPQIMSHYLVTFSDYKYGTWATPTLGTVLRLIFGAEKDWLQVVPSIIGIGWVFFYWLKNKDTWDWLRQMPILIFASVITSAYVWTYDMVVLLIPILAIVVDMMRVKFNWMVGLYLFIFVFANLVTFYLHITFYDYFFIWFAPFLLLWYLFGFKIVQWSKQYQQTLGQESTKIN